MPPVVVGIMWKLVFQPQAGVLNELLYRAHLPGSNIDWLSDFTWALPAVILVGVWAGMPQTTIALLAGVQSIPDDLHEAAAVDGATALAALLDDHAAAAAAGDRRDHHARPDLELQLVRARLRADARAGRATRPSCRCCSPTTRRSSTASSATPSALGDAMVVVIACSLVFYLWGRLKETTQ